MKLDKITNRSLLPDWQVYRWFDPQFYSEFLIEAIVLPDVCPAGLIPNGTVAITHPGWLEKLPFANIISDIGCSMSLAKIPNLGSIEENKVRKLWDDLYCSLKALDKTVLGSGNHFIDGCVEQDGAFFIVVHVGSRMTQAEKAQFRYARDYNHFVNRAMSNHDEIWEHIGKTFGQCGQRFTLCHDTITENGDTLCVRKGVMLSEPGGLVLIASSFEDTLLFGKAKNEVQELNCSISHGTGRVRSRGDAKQIDVDAQDIRRRIIIPKGLEDSQWLLEAPAHYRPLSDILPFLERYVDVTHRLMPIAFMGGF